MKGFLCFVLGMCGGASGELTRTWGESAEERAATRHAVESGLKVIQRSMAAYPEHRTCFSCHHQTVPMQALAIARDRGFEIDRKLFQEQTQLSYDTFKARVDRLKEGTGIGGKSMTVGFGLWALDLGNWKADETTSAMIQFLLKNQEPGGHYWSNLERPPLEDSVITGTTVAAYYMQKFAGDSEQDEVKRSVAQARAWLFQARPKSQEDFNSKLWALHLFGADQAAVEPARQAVLNRQRPDGGWAQLDEMENDSYATGQTLFVLEQTGLPVDHEAYRRGTRFLLDTQLADGTWHVKTRSRPIQTFFDSEFPHGKDQFISICGTSWAVAALAAAHSPEGQESPKP